MKNIIVIISLLVLLGSCSSYDKDLGKPLDIMYNQAIHSMVTDDLYVAKASFKRIVDEYPYRDEAIEAQIFLIWINYFEEDYVSAEINIDAFLKYYVYNDYTPWVKYMQALVFYEQIPDKERDFSNTNNALMEFFDITRRNPDSVYAKDAIYKIQALKYKISQKNMEIAKFYLKNKNYIAAMSSYKDVVDMYSDTIFIQEALYRITYIWLSLGVDEEAFKTVSVLGYNYPDSHWYKEALNLLEEYTEYDEKSQLKRSI